MAKRSKPGILLPDFNQRIITAAEARLVESAIKCRNLGNIYNWREGSLAYDLMKAVAAVVKERGEK